MLYAIMYLDTRHRVRIYAEGGYSCEKKVDGIGWCLEADETCYPGEQLAFATLGALCLKHAARHPDGRIEAGPEDYTATHDYPSALNDEENR